jgi:hypothetical protein
MPKLYEYLGIIILFYANEHEPVHVHGRKAGKESKAEITVKDGTEYIITLKSVSGKPPLDNNDLKEFKSFVTVYAEKIVQKWIDFFVLNKPVSPEIILQKVKK